MPDRILKIKYSDISEIQRAFGPAGVYYYVFYKDENGRKKKIEFTQNLEDSELLINYLERKSKVKMRQEGTLEIKDADGPFVKIVK